MTQMQDQKISIHVKLIAKPDKLKELLDILAVCAASTRAEPGCEYHEVMQDIVNPLHITLVEKYTNIDAFNAHFHNQDIRDFIDNKQHQLLDAMSSHVYITRVYPMGSIGNVDVVDLPFRHQFLE